MEVDFYFMLNGFIFYFKIHPCILPFGLAIAVPVCSGQTWYKLHPYIFVIDVFLIYG